MGQENPPFVSYLAYTGSPHTFSARGDEGQFATWEEFVEANPGAEGAESKFARVGCDRCDWSLMCDVFHERNPSSPLPTIDAVSLTVGQEDPSTFSRTGPTTSRCRRCTDGEFSWHTNYRFASDEQRANRTEVLKVWRALCNELRAIGVEKLVRLEGDETRAIYVFPPSGDGGLSWIVDVARGPVAVLDREGGAGEMVRRSREEV